MKRVLVVGAGMGGLTAAVRLAQRGFGVTVLEARDTAGGLASSFVANGFRFDAGPYILLDRPGLEWAFNALGVEMVELRAIDSIYQVDVGGIVVRFYASLEQTAAEIDRNWPGSGARYQRFVESMGKTYRRLQPQLLRPHAGAAGLLRDGSWKEGRFLLRSLGSVLAATGLPEQVQQAIGIWTHVAGQTLGEAPSPLAFVPALIHEVGCFYPVHGMGSIPAALVKAAERAGVSFRFGEAVTGIRAGNGRVTGVETGEGFLEAEAVVSNHSAVGTYVKLLDSVSPGVRRRAAEISLQSPGVCAYLAVKGGTSSPYLRFLLPEAGRCRLRITPSSGEVDGWRPARLLGPMDFAEAERLGESGQQEYLDGLLANNWWWRDLDDYRVLARRVPAQWGADFHLYRDSMNPVMTAKFMRQGRFAHRSPHVRGLYLAGSSTHPGQWVSFCAISGILAADCAIEDLC